MKWNYDSVKTSYPYGDTTSYKLGMSFLDGVGDIEDWGCGLAFAKTFVTKSKYIGLDITPSAFCDKVIDLTTYTSSVDCIFMRHVLEHNHTWKTILENALNSFQKKMILILFTPLEPTTRDLNGNPDYSFKLEDITEPITKAKAIFNMKKIKSETQYGVEYIFYIEKLQ